MHATGDSMAERRGCVLWMQNTEMQMSDEWRWLI